MARRTVEILIPVALDQTYTYCVPEAMNVAVGAFVTVPLGARECTGIVWAEAAQARPGLHNRLKDITATLDVAPLKPELRAFVDWVADYTLAARGMVLRMCLRRGEQLGPERARVGVRATGQPPGRMTAARGRVLAVLADGLARGKADAAREAGVSAGVIDGLIDDGALATLVLAPEPVARAPDPSFQELRLTPAQATAAFSLRLAVARGGYSVTLLDGVTGAGKTDVYFEAVSQAIRDGRQVLILMPEIALTAQFLERFAARFGTPPAQWHSQLPPRQRARAWNAVAQGEVGVIAGARSALFLPFRDLGLIIVDEEHDPAYKQEDGVRYHARDMAVVRANIARIPLLLVSATPSIETEVNARRGRYDRVWLPDRFSGQPPPALEAIDLRSERPAPGRFLAARLVEAVGHALDRGEQALLFLNRRGYAPLTLCRACGMRFSCPNCDAWLVDHRFRRQLVCHHCGFAMPQPAQCPKCAATDSFVACGPGVERLEEEVAALFPSARVLVLSSDLVAGVLSARMHRKKGLRVLIDVGTNTEIVAGDRDGLVACSTPSGP
ncbi:MAG: primosomal protein N', partial [Proteobacteria bacterium]|nr:primosomal protein N' [Pseudomonadota bacterium]